MYVVFAVTCTIPRSETPTMGWSPARPGRMYLTIGSARSAAQTRIAFPLNKQDAVSDDGVGTYNR
jgi:hypothetical protein